MPHLKQLPIEYDSESYADSEDGEAEEVTSRTRIEQSWKQLK